MADPQNGITPIPAEWRDPVHVMPHLADELAGWHATLSALEQDLSVIQGALDPQSFDISIGDLGRTLDGLEAVRGRMAEVNHQLSQRLTVFRLIAEDLQRG